MSQSHEIIDDNYDESASSKSFDVSKDGSKPKEYLDEPSGNIDTNSDIIFKFVYPATTPVYEFLLQLRTFSNIKFRAQKITYFLLLVKLRYYQWHGKFKKFGMLCWGNCLNVSVLLCPFLLYAF